MRSDEALDPIRSLRASWDLLKRTHATAWIHGALLFVGEVGGAVALLYALFVMPPGACRRDSSEWDPREIAGVIGLVLFVGSSVTWKSLAEVVVPQLDSRENVRRDPRVLAVLAARFAGEIYGLLAAAPLILCLICGRGWIVGPAAVLSLWFFAYFALGLVFVPQVAAFEELGVVDSLVRSWSLARGRRLRLLAYHAALRGGLALAACSVVGLFFAAPLVNLSRIESYLALTRALDREAPRA